MTIKFCRTSLAIAISVCMNSSAFAWNLNDVSVLMPLPSEKAESNLLLRPDQAGPVGVLLPRAVYDRIGPLSNASEVSNRTYDYLRAVSFRFDPCPSEAVASSACRPEFRMVWQPLVKNSHSSIWEAEDDAIHTFYRLNETQFVSMKKGLLDLKTEMKKYGVDTENQALGIHPALKKSSASEIFLKEFKRIVLANVGEANFYKVTFMKLLVQDNWWKFFAGFERSSSGQWIRGEIPRHGGTEIDILNDASEINPSTGQVDEADTSIFALSSYPERDDLRYIVSSGFRKTYKSSTPQRDDFAQFSMKMGAIGRFQNPTLTNPHTVDCAHCHYADAARVFATKVFPELKSAVEKHPDHYLAPKSALFNLSNETNAISSTKMVHAFGYVSHEPSIMTRTIHDSVESADWLNRHP